MLKREGETPENTETETGGSTETGKGQGGKGQGGQGKGEQEQGGQGKGKKGQGDNGGKKSDEENNKGGCEEKSAMETIMMYLEDLEHTDPFRGWFLDFQCIIIDG